MTNRNRHIGFFTTLCALRRYGAAQHSAACLKALALLALALMIVMPASATAGTYPAKPIRLVAPYAVGASADQLARILAERIAHSLGQPVIVENRGGAGGTVGSDLVAKAAPDGYSIVIGTDASHAANLFLSKQFPYDPVKSFTPLTPAAQNRIVLVVHPSVPVKSVKELISYAKAHPDKLFYGSSGLGTPHHLAGELLNKSAGIHLVHVAYKGGGPAMVDLLGGQIPMAFASLATAKPHIESGKLRALAFIEPTRFPGLPDVPTIGETLPGYALTSWLAVFAPSGLPDPIAARLNAEINKALEEPAVRKELEAAGMTATGGTRQALTEIVKNTLEQRATLIKSAGITPD